MFSLSPFHTSSIILLFRSIFPTQSSLYSNVSTHLHPITSIFPLFRSSCLLNLFSLSLISYPQSSGCLSRYISAYSPFPLSGLDITYLTSSLSSFAHSTTSILSTSLRNPAQSHNTSRSFLTSFATSPNVYNLSSFVQSPTSIFPLFRLNSYLTPSPFRPHRTISTSSSSAHSERYLHLSSFAPSYLLPQIFLFSLISYLNLSSLIAHVSTQSSYLFRSLLLQSVPSFARSPPQPVPLFRSSSYLKISSLSLQSSYPQSSSFAHNPTSNLSLFRSCPIFNLSFSLSLTSSLPPIFPLFRLISYTSTFPLYVSYSTVNLPISIRLISAYVNLSLLSSLLFLPSIFPLFAHLYPQYSSSSPSSLSLSSLYLPLSFSLLLSLLSFALAVLSPLLPPPFSFISSPLSLRSSSHLSLLSYFHPSSRFLPLVYLFSHITSFSSTLPPPFLSRSLPLSLSVLLPSTSYSLSLSSPLLPHLSLTHPFPLLPFFSSPTSISPSLYALYPLSLSFLCLPPLLSSALLFPLSLSIPSVASTSSLSRSSLAPLPFSLPPLSIIFSSSYLPFFLSSSPPSPTSFLTLFSLSLSSALSLSFLCPFLLLSLRSPPILSLSRLSLPSTSLLSLLSSPLSSPSLLPSLSLTPFSSFYLSLLSFLSSPPSLSLLSPSTPPLSLSFLPPFYLLSLSHLFPLPPPLSLSLPFPPPLPSLSLLFSTPLPSF
ncbi:hypothetical protein C7M84_007496 [Penaeus vannamei]|uniref:Uncharacterized protein n=1 Tax=Penaeus vannamei TaxID=6689 RepID=A0A423TC00_PENVA|nr:hypothetical protein C7M84_007496 [Penaeus vannamei]